MNRLTGFPYGIAALCILALALASGVWLAAHPVGTSSANLTMWTFANTHYDAYKAAVPSFEKAHPGVRVDVQLVSGTAVTSRLQAAFWADLDVPDLVEAEISNAASFFRGPLEHVGFLDLTDRIHRSGLWDGMVQARFAPYTTRGRIFGLPHDVHPVQLAYRRDLVEGLGIDVSKIETWDDFVAAGRRVTIPNKRYMLEMPDTDASRLEMCLFQRGGGYFDQQGRCRFDDEVGVQTMLWYVPLVAGPRRIGGDLGGGQILTKAIEDGYLLFLAAPDWRTRSFEMDAPRVSGKMALMPLPAVKRGGPRTSTWGGTMLGITRRSPHPDLAWEFARHLYLNPAELAERFRGTNIIPALRSAWRQPAFSEPRPYWSNQRLGDSYALLAPQTPYQYASPFISTAKGKLGEALVACVQRYRAEGDAGFEPFVRRQMGMSAGELRRLMARSPFL
ncbi:MAG: extracellular solute-binding protein [Armatimonadetes bacterium]|nr:extracellular solute-binding protein [Armatimonadota bacterium]